MPRLATILLLLAFTAHADYFAEGNRHFDQGNLPSAIASYRQQIATGRVSPALHYNLGNAYFSRGMLDEATGAYRRALELKPDYVEAYYQLGGVFIRLKKYDNHNTDGKVKIDKLVMKALTMTLSDDTSQDTKIYIRYMLARHKQCRPVCEGEWRQWFVTTTIDK